MDPTLLMIATTAGTALVQAMTSDGWAVARQRFVNLLTNRDSTRHAECEQALDSTAAALRHRVLDRDNAIRHWRREFEVLLATNPGAASELQMLAGEYGSVSAPCGIASRNVSISATDSGTAIGVQNNGAAVGLGPFPPGMVRS